MQDIHGVDLFVCVCLATLMRPKWWTANSYANTQAQCCWPSLLIITHKLSKGCRISSFSPQEICKSVTCATKATGFWVLQCGLKYLQSATHTCSSQAERAFGVNGQRNQNREKSWQSSEVKKQAYGLERNSARWETVRLETDQSAGLNRHLSIHQEILNKR